MKKRKVSPLHLNRETLLSLTPEQMANVMAGVQVFTVRGCQTDTCAQNCTGSCQTCQDTHCTDPIPT